MFSKAKKPEIDKEAKLVEFRGCLTDEVNSMLTDEDCHRFLVARDYDIPKSVELVNKWAEWYMSPMSDFKIENKDLCPRNMANNMCDNKEDLLKGSFLYSNLGEDKQGRPIYWEKIGLQDEMVVRHIRQQEMMIQRLERASQKYGRRITKQVAVLDLKHLTLSPDRMGFNVLHRSIKIDEAFYPERLETLFAINAPIYFTAIWAIVKPWIDPVTLKKIQILGSNYQEALKEMIADDQIPVEYGGTRENFSWEWPSNFEG